MKEIFKDVKGYEGIYKVSNLGNVKSMERISNGGYYRVKEKILNKHKNKAGYEYVGLYLEGKSTTRTVHQLVAIAFLNHIPNGYNLIVDHIDNNPSNNRVDNLQITTPRENTSKDKKEGTSKYTGVCWAKNANKWLSCIRIEGKKVHLGLFKCELAAAKAYNDKLRTIKL